MGHYIVLGITFAFAAAVQPGPLQTYLISQALIKGWRRTLPAALAPLLSDGPIILLVLLLLLKIPQWLLHLIQLLGGFFLLFLAFSAWKTWRNYDVAKAVREQSVHQTLLRATLVNLLNPNPYLAWSLIMGPLLKDAWKAAPANGIGLLVGFYLTMILTSIIIIVLFAAAGSLGTRVGRFLVLISAAVLAGFGLYTLWNGFIAFFPKSGT